MSLSLYYPAKPYIVRQAFGVYNPAYEQFGFNKHNGIDFAVDTDGIVRAMCDGVVTEVKDYIKDGKYYGAGKAVRYRTLTKVQAEGEFEYVEFMYMHADKQLVTVGQVLKAGDPVIIADNTGFSTGPHTHISAYFVDINAPTGGNKLQIGDKSADYCFDHSKYFNGKFSDDLLASISPQTEALVMEGIAVAAKAGQYSALRGGAIKLLESLSDYLKNNT